MPRKIGRKYRKILFALTMSASTTFMVTGVILALQGLMGAALLQRWAVAFATAWPIVFIAILVIAPGVDRLLDIVVEKAESEVL